MKKSKRCLSLIVSLLCIMLAFSSVVGAESASTFATNETSGMTSFTLSQELNKKDGPVTASDTFGFSDYKKKTVPIYEYTFEVPAGTTEVVLSFTSSDTENGCFVEAESGTLSLMNDYLQPKTKPANALNENKTTVDIVNGTGSTKCILSYTATGSEMNRKWSVGNNKIFRFCFVEASDTISLETPLPERIQYNQGDTAQALSIAVNAPNGSDIQYRWYYGATAETAATLIEGANTNEYTPTTDTVGVTYYRVTATIPTEEGKAPVVLNSTAKFVVKDPNVQFALTTYTDFHSDFKLESSENYAQLYTLKWDSKSLRELIYVFGGKISGTLPDNVTIEKVWSGSPGEEYDLSKEGAVKYDYDKNTFVIDLVTAATPEVADIAGKTSVSYQHFLGRCLYLKTSTGKVYTIVADGGGNDESYWKYHPEYVELVDQNGTALSDYRVSSPATGVRSSSVVSGSLTSDAPVVLRAQVCNSDIGFVGHKIEPRTFAASWKESQLNWVLVNGEPVGGTFHGKTDTANGISPAFTLQPGLNVIEVYTNLRPYWLQNDSAETRSGLIGTVFSTNAAGEDLAFKSIATTSVVYLIDYQGTSAQNIPQDNQTDTSLQEVQALRFGVTNSLVAECPLIKNGDGYLLTVPKSFDTDKGESTYFREYTHAVLLAAKPKIPGAKAEFSGVEGLVLGESVADSAFLNMEALYGKEEKSFTIKVTAADGKTTKEYPVNVVYASDAAIPTISVTGGASLDTAFNAETYAYYLDYKSMGELSFLNVSLPDGATATINNEAFTGEKQIELNKSVDFYRLTITAADNKTVKTYYFVTRLEKDGSIPYATVSDNSKKLAKDMLWKYYENLKDTTYFSGYWNIFMAKAATGYDTSVPAFDFSNKYVKDPARHKMENTTDWAACIMEIVMLGYDPYHFPRYVDGKYVADYNYVEGFRNQTVGAYANSTWYQFAAKAIGDPITMKKSMESLALNSSYDLDTRAWSIASLAGCVETKDMVRYVDSLHDSHITDGEFKSLWRNLSWDEPGANNYTVGCVLQAIAASGADPDKLFAYGGNTPLQTIQNVMFRDDGYFYSSTTDKQAGALPKDMIIGLGDILYGSSVWVRYALTAEKYNALIDKAKTEGISITDMPTFEENNEASSRAYFKLYQQVADKLEANNDYSMRPKVTFGMPYELFSDKVKAMPEAFALTTNDLSKLKALIAEYEGLDDSNKSALASLNRNDESNYYGVLTKYQALVAKGLSLKAQQDGITSKADDLYKKILALPDAANIDDSNKEQVKASVDAIRDAMSKADEDLLKWAGASVLGKLEAVEQELEDPREKITVTFTLLGDHKHTETETNVKHTLTAGNLETWIAESTYQVNPDTTVWDFMQPILEKNGIKWDAGTGDSVYVKSLTYKGKTIGEFTNGKLSGWKYTVNGEYPDVSVAAKKLSAGDEIIFHYTDDYTVDDIKGGDKPDPTPSGDKYTDQQISDAYRATGNALALKNPTTGSVGGEWLMLGLARADHVISSSSKDAYLSSVRSYINENYNSGKLSKDKSTENSRIILALTALGEDPQTFVTGKNLLEGYSDFDWTVQQGVTGPIFALLAIDSQKYTVPDYATIRNDLIEEILKAQENNGGWSADGKTVDVDMTAMAIQALAPYYKKNNTDVVEPVNAALGYLVSQQNEATGAFPNAKSELSAESTAQVIVALTSLGKNPATEKRFQAGDKKLSPIDGLMRFYQENGKFSHKLDADANDMATEQSYYALVSYYRLKNDKTSLYDMTDLKDTTPETVASVIEKINDIGPVTENSYEDIIAAEEAYNKLSNADKAQLPEEYLDILNNAKQEYAVLLANKKTDAKKELNDYYLGIDQKDYGEAGRKKLSEILAKAQRDITSAKSCPQVESILRQAISDLDAVRKGDITVSFRLIGSLEATQDVNLTTDSYLPEYVTWIPTTKYELASNATVYDLFTEALSDAGLSAIGAEGGYVKTIYAPSCLGGYALSEFSNGKRSGWMYTLNGKHSSNALTDQKLEDGDMVVWHYVNDYSHEVSDWSGDSQHPSLGNGTYYNGWLRAADISPERYVEQLLGKILTVGKNGTVEPKLTLSHLGKSVTFTFKPDKGYRVKDVKVDGKSVGPVASYTVDKLSVSTRIEVTFTNGKLPFTDVRESDWFYDDVVFAYENGLFSGTSDTTFSPNTSMTRAMLVTVLYRLEGQPAVNGRSGFSDVQYNGYYEDAVTWAADNGIVNGISTSTFSPNANVTREQMAAILYRYAQYKKYNTAASSSLNSFSDHASVSGYAVMPLQWAVAEKLINGSAGKLMPTGNATRAQVAAILHRFVTNVAK